MNCNISVSAAMKLKEILAQEEEKRVKIPCVCGSRHGDHAYYGLGLDYQKDSDELVVTKTGISVLLERGQVFLDGIEVDYNASKDEWSIINPSKGSHEGHE